jgi:hypothetical protein
MVESKQRKHLGRGGELLVVRKVILVMLRVFLVFGNCSPVERFDHIDVDRYTSTISMSGPLRVLQRNIGSVYIWTDKVWMFALTKTLALS